RLLRLLRSGGESQHQRPCPALPGPGPAARGYRPPLSVHLQRRPDLRGRRQEMEGGGMSEERRIHIEVPVLARVEGEGALHLRIEDGRIEHLQLRIFEPPRFFEKFLEGRAWHEVPDVVARICGICPVAYQMSAVQALEDIFGIDPDPWVRAMRRVMYCGEWIQSHALHIHLLAAPDFFGCNSVVELARDHAGE